MCRPRENVLVIHSLSKRSGMTGYRSGFMAGEPDLIAKLREARANFGVAPQSIVQQAAAVAWDDDAHVEARRNVFAQKRAVPVACALSPPDPVPTIDLLQRFAGRDSDSRTRQRSGSRNFHNQRELQSENRRERWQYSGRRQYRHDPIGRHAVRRPSGKDSRGWRGNFRTRG